MRESPREPERHELREQVEEAFARKSPRAALKLLERMGEQSQRGKDIDGLEEVVELARTLQASVRSRQDAYECGKLAYAAERNIEVLGGTSAPASRLPPPTIAESAPGLKRLVLLLALSAAVLPL